MQYKVFVVNPIEENCYVVWDEASREAAIIDCGAFTADEKASISLFLSENQLKLKYALQTHMHFDHSIGLPFIKDQYGLSPICAEADMPTYDGVPAMLERWFRIKLNGQLPQPEVFITEKDVFTLGETSIQPILTPGHTPGGICYYIPEARLLFSGDTLFCQSIGRTDLPGGSYKEIITSISEKLVPLPEDTVVLPGHGPETTIGRERQSNPYVQ